MSEFTIVSHDGETIDLLDPDPESFLVNDIVWGMGHIYRFAGHSDITLLDHSVRVCKILRDWGADRKVQIQGLMHDAHEVYIGDVPRPLKEAMRHLSHTNYSVYDDIEDKFMRAMAVRFGYDYPLASQVKDADQWAFQIETQIKNDQWEALDQMGVTDALSRPFLRLDFMKELTGLYIPWG